MWHFSSSRALRRRHGVVAALLCVAALGLGACGLRVTNERPSYDELDGFEQSAVQQILRELRGLNAQITARSAFSIASSIDAEKIHVSFEGLIFSGNFGDDAIHVSVWDNLTDAQRIKVQTWFGKTTLIAAKSAYQQFFYRFLAASQGVKQYMYEVLTPGWVFSNRSLFNIERDSIRAALSYYRATGQRAAMWGFVDSVCNPMIAQHNARLKDKFDKKYLAANFQKLANPEDPTDYVYFICRWAKMGMEDSVNLTVEFDWLRNLPQLEARGG